MAVTKKHVTLCQEGNKDVEYYPNIETENVPDNAITKAKLSQSVQDDIDGKAPQSTTYTKSETDALLNEKANASSVYTKSETYTKTETNTLLNAKANASDVYNKTQVDNALDLKADKSTTYTKTETDTLLNGKQDTLIFDNVPTEDSANPVKSGGIYNALGNKQDTLVSGTNIKTINNNSLLGDGNIAINGSFENLTATSIATYSTDKLKCSVPTGFIYNKNGLYSISSGLSDDIPELFYIKDNNALFSIVNNNQEIDIIMLTANASNEIEFYISDLSGNDISADFDQYEFTFTRLMN